MKKILAVIGIACAILLGYRMLFAESESYLVYKEFARVLAYDDYDAALRMTMEGSEAWQEVSARKKGRGMVRIGTYSVSGIGYELESETSADGGRTIVNAVRTCRVSGDGQESAFGRPVSHHQVVTMKSTASGWKVEKFEEALAGE